MLPCNTHVHSPYSFSVFSSVDEMVSTARAAGIAVLGINDGTTVDGFKEFDLSCRSQGIYPLFNIEFAVECDGDHRRSGSHHVPFSPKHCWLHGKALRFPAMLSSDSRNLLASIWKASQDRIWKLIETVNFFLDRQGLPLSLDYASIRADYTKSSVHDLHIARALEALLSEHFNNREKAVKHLNELMGFTEHDSLPSAPGKLTNALCRELGSGSAFERINRRTGPSIQLLQAKQVILQAGGIPSFQCSFNNDDEWMKESEGPELLARQLSAKGIHAVEFIPGETSCRLLETFMRYFHEHHFLVTMGSDHSECSDASLLPVTRDGKIPGDDLLSMCYESVCIYAAHQEMHYRERRGFVDESGKRLIPPEQVEPFIALGEQAIKTATGR